MGSLRHYISLIVACAAVTWADSSCPLTCDNGVGMIANPGHCGQFYVCMPHGDEGPYLCPADLPYFNGTDCVAHYSCCTNPCKAFCVRGGTEIPDPFDCTGYYFCVEEGPPTEDLHFYCNAGEKYDPILQLCHSDAPCNVACPLTTDPPSSTTTTEVPHECLDSLLCKTNGLFRKCNFCHPEYFLCPGAGQYGWSQSCAPGNLFNPSLEDPRPQCGPVCPLGPPYVV